jgi:heme/copper-type cytochrome/quinol oxidase subunit 4
MCFSATASFGASAVLGTVGILSVAKAKTNPQRTFATIPLLFAVQQFTEGLLWLSLKNDDMASWQSSLTYIFLVFAMAVWPFWIPFSIWVLEKDAKRKKLIKIFVWIGAAVAIGVCFILFSYPVQVVTPFCFNCPGSPSPSPRDHLHYEFAIPSMVKNMIVAFSVLYIAATIVTPFFSSIKKMKWLGVVFLASYLFAILFYRGFVISVWCFFAALLSFVVLWIIIDLRRKKI